MFYHINLYSPVNNYSNLYSCQLNEVPDNVSFLGKGKIQVILKMNHFSSKIYLFYDKEFKYLEIVLNSSLLTKFFGSDFVYNFRVFCEHEFAI